MDTQSGPKNGQEGNEAESLATRPSGALGMPEGTEEVELMEDGAKDRLGRMRLTERRKEELVEEYRASGQRVSDFARQTGVNESTLRHWLKERPPGPEGGKAKFAELRVKGAEAVEYARGLSVTLPGGVVARGEDAGRLGALVRALMGGGS
ncbi:transposase [Termitidicoccus mucosus]|uniref:Transposase n=1 Tax=Termitidicoccus mucosus TaxID=1184151 RepID=A0A178IF79_9BACT|nr:hypothetical protein AW736_17950 [Opitutaceae bacterium TSB47]OAM88274.1 hypothetical protein AW736_17975 [Opitutaceae bacterium TSB47]